MGARVDAIDRHVVSIAICWTVAILCSFAWLCRQERRNVQAIALAEAKATYQKDALYRRWATKQGGFYVPISRETPPSPYLSHIPERDIVTPSGRRLTLVNPAYMTRQVFEFASQDTSQLVRGHITSLKPIRPENAADPWEREALLSFQNGAKDASVVQTIDGRQYLRFMRPFLTETGCLKCHAHQGYKLGDVRGGISATVAIDEYTAYSRNVIAGGAATHGVIWLMGLGIVGFGRRALSRSAAVLRESEERYRTVADFTADWEYWLAPDNSLRYMSHSCRAMAGYGREEFYSDPDLLRRIVHPEDLSVFDGHFHLNTPDGEPKAIDFRIVTRSGEIRWISHVCRTVYRKDGRENGSRASNRDITDRKRAEEALHLQTMLLEQEMAERQKAHEALYAKTAALEQEILERQVAQQNLEEQTVVLEQEIEERQVVQQNLEEQTVALELEIDERKRVEQESLELREQLLHSQKMEAIGLLAGGVAHDFNNILTVILGYGEILAMKLQETGEREKAVQIVRAAERAAELTKGLLAFGKKQAFNLTIRDINQLVAENGSFLKRVIGEEIELATELSPEPLNVMMDSSQIQLVLMNHATNAREAMPEGGKLTIGVERLTLDEDFIALQGRGTPGPYALIRVQDTGCGMSKETTRRIFEPFFTTKGMGTGLGLAITHGIVSQHNGFIRCESEQGKGTTFFIYLPIAGAESVAVAAGSGDGFSIPRGSETVLLAEDDPFLMEMTTGCLEANGYKVLQAEDGAKAVELFQRHREDIDLVVLDAIMPKLTGKQAWSQITALRPEVKGLFVSGYTNDIISGKVAIDYSVPFIGKPLKPSAFLRKVREVLDGGAGGRQDDGVAGTGQRG